MSDIYNKEEIEKEWASDDRAFEERKLQRQKKLQERKEREERRRKLIGGFAAVVIIVVIAVIAWFFLTDSSGNSSGTSGESAAVAEESQTAENETSAAESSTAAETSAAETTVEAESETEDLTLDDEASRLSGEVPTDEEVASFFSGYSVDASAADTITDEAVNSTNAVLVNLDTGAVVAEKDASAVISPASMTKILTVLVAAEHLTQADLDKTVTISDEVSDYVYRNDCSIAGFETGETVTVRDLFYGTILPSGADAALALADFVAGSQENFVEMMNDKLDDLGLSGTAHFTNCIGLYDEDHYCTVTDMAMMLKAAVSDSWCRQVLSAHTYTTTVTTQHPEGITLSNWFLRRIEDKDTHGEVRCAKTGFVNEAGCCAASYSISNDGTHYICVTANTYSTWSSIYDHVAIYDDYTN